MSRDALKIEIYSLLAKNGFAFTSQGVDSFADRLLAEQFVQDGSSTWWSPSGEPLIDAIYRAWGDSTPAIAPTKPAPSTPHQLPWDEADIANTKDPAIRLRKLADNEEAAGKMHKSAAVKTAAGLPNGMTPEQFARLSPEEKIRLGNEQTRQANGWSAGGVGF